jgi:hypothetical protein
VNFETQAVAGSVPECLAEPVPIEDGARRGKGGSAAKDGGHQLVVGDGADAERRQAGRGRGGSHLASIATAN